MDRMFNLDDERRRRNARRSERPAPRVDIAQASLDALREGVNNELDRRDAEARKNGSEDSKK